MLIDITLKITPEMLKNAQENEKKSLQGISARILTL